MELLPMRKIFYFLLIAFLASCNANQEKRSLTGNYLFNVVFEAENESFNLPFNLLINKDSSISITNGGEQIKVTEAVWMGDSLFFQMPVFMTEFQLQYTNGEFEGVWIKKDREEPVKHPVFSQKNAPRFNAQKSKLNVSGKWKTTFSYPNGEQYLAIGEFKQEGSVVTGTFMTETGDYRFLEGVVSGDSLKLSTFDGAHAFLFLAQKQAEKISGIFKASHTHLEFFEMEKDPSFKLADANTLTFLKPGYQSLEFSFPMLDGDSVRFPSSRFENKVVIVQLMGSWCPNCMDETAFFNELHQKYSNKGLEIISVGFERFKDVQKSMKAVQRVKNHFGTEYIFALGGISRKETAAEAFPMLNHVMSFPTSIFVDKKGEVRKIHTGFSGPGTSKYNQFVEETTSFIELLLNE